MKQKLRHTLSTLSTVLNRIVNFAPKVSYKGRKRKNPKNKLNLIKTTPYDNFSLESLIVPLDEQQSISLSINGSYLCLHFHNQS